MFILEDPYVSDYLINTLNINNYSTFENKYSKNKVKNIVNKIEENEKIYTNSENALYTALQMKKEADFEKMIKFCKDKSEFRKILKEIYPDYYYEEVNLNKNEKINPKKYPVILKPAVGFLSFGVKKVNSENELNKIADEIKTDIDKTKGMFPNEVVNYDKFIIEEFIEGEEFAADIYYNSEGKSVILNIYHHPFLNKDDTKDRLYVTSYDIVKDNIKDFEKLFDKIGKLCNFKDFPTHIELRKTKNGIIPIEYNPLRFAGWCLCDLAQYAHKINVYKYFMENKKPEFDKNDKNIYGFVMAEVPFDINKNDIISFDINKFKEDMNAEILESREFDFKEKPVFASFFIKSDNYNKIKHILKMDVKGYINCCSKRNSI